MKKYIKVWYFSMLCKQWGNNGRLSMFLLYMQIEATTQYIFKPNFLNVCNTTKLIADLGPNIQ